jgi:hypothetical protein
MKNLLGRKKKQNKKKMWRKKITFPLSFLLKLVCNAYITIINLVHSTVSLSFLIDNMPFPLTMKKSFHNKTKKKGKYRETKLSCEKDKVRLKLNY